MPNQSSALPDLTRLLRDFVDKRDWDQFHTPRNLATALSVEAAELLEPFQWMGNDAAEGLPQATLEQVTAEMADVFAYLLLLADKLNVNLGDALKAKIESNEAKYPVDVVRGSAKKYTEY